MLNDPNLINVIEYIQTKDNLFTIGSLKMAVPGPVLGLSGKQCRFPKSEGNV